MPYFDGHSHTTYSDGLESPEQLVDGAHAAGIRVLAVTDHDTFAGHDRAAARAAQVGIELVRGVEISCDLDGREQHLLVYFVGDGASALGQALDAALAERRSHLGRALARLGELGLAISEAEVLAEVKTVPGQLEPQSIGRPHIARALVRKGHAKTVDEVFDRWLGNDKPGYVRRAMPSIERMIELARAAGGVCSVAHPGAYDLREQPLRRLAALGVAGIEVYHPQHDPSDIVFYLRQCEYLKLVPTGGSDHHGSPEWPFRSDGPGLDQPGYERLLARRAA